MIKNSNTKPLLYGKEVLGYLEMLIGLTGGIGSGKSLAGDFFKSKNIDVIDADDLAQNALDREERDTKSF